MISVSFYLKRPKDSGGILRTTPVSIFAVITKSRTERFPITLDEKIVPKDWDPARQRVKSSARDHAAINLLLTTTERDLITLYRENRGKSWSEFRLLAAGGVQPEKKSLIIIYDKFLDHHLRNKSVGSKKAYYSLRAHLNNVGGASLEGMEMNFLDRLTAYLYKLKRKDSTVSNLLTKLKTFLSWAIERGYPVNPDYKKWKIAKPRISRPITLTLAELEKLEAAILPYGPSIGRDYLCIEARTGARISDVKRFDVKDFDGIRWTYNRKKGNTIRAKRVRVPNKGFCAPAFDRLKRLDYKLPQRDETLINRWIRKACQLAGINEMITVETLRAGELTSEEVPKWKKITSHTGRKTFITLGLQYMPPKIVKGLAGLESYSTLRYYEGDSEDAIVERHLEDMDTKMKAG